MKGDASDRARDDRRPGGCGDRRGSNGRGSNLIPLPSITVGIGAGRIQLRDATASDLRALAQLHRDAYSRDHFLALLPEGVLADYYARFLGDGSRIVVAVAETGTNAQASADEILGFAVFGRNIEPRIAAFKRDRRWTIALAALQHPTLVARKVFTAVGGRLRGGTEPPPAPALLLSIAVGETGKGVGRVLLEEILRRSAAAGENRIGLYVRHHNVAAINAYLRVGFSIVQSISDQYYMERMLVSAPSSRDA
jgi:ribosomal protein S18 acetylase RimI-like enzyme